MSRQLCLLVLGLVVASCGVDDRSLTASALSRAGAGGGGASSGSSVGGAGFGGSAINAHAGAAGLAGAVNPEGEAGQLDQAGAAGEHTTGGAGAAGGVAGGSDAASGGSGGAPLGSSTGGVAGSSVAGPCGDIDQNGVDDCSETLVSNSRFTSDVTQWSAELYDTLAWDARNADAAESSGALRVSNTAPVADGAGAFMTGGHQCIAVTPGVSYVTAARTLILGTDTASQAGINVQIFDGDNCSGTFLGAQTPAMTADLGTWRVLKGELKMPPAARSIWLRLVASKPFVTDELDALFDDVLVRAE